MRAATIAILLITSLVVGLLMSSFGVTPGDIYKAVGTACLEAWEALKAFLDSNWGTALLWGASIVIPIYAIYWMIQRWRNRPPPPRTGIKGAD